MAETGSKHKFDHVVSVMFENRSFDNMLGYLYQPNQVPHGQQFDGVAGKDLFNSVNDPVTGVDLVLDGEVDVGETGAEHRDDLPEALRALLRLTVQGRVVERVVSGELVQDSKVPVVPCLLEEANSDCVVLFR